jgi:hypothetical protein
MQKPGKKVNPHKNSSYNILNPASSSNPVEKHRTSTSPFANTKNIASAGASNLNLSQAEPRRQNIQARAKVSQMASILTYEAGPMFKIDTSRKQGVVSKPTDRIQFLRND